MPILLDQNHERGSEIAVDVVGKDAPATITLHTFTPKPRDPATVISTTVCLAASTVSAPCVLMLPSFPPAYPPGSFDPTPEQRVNDDNLRNVAFFFMHCPDRVANCNARPSVRTPQDFLSFERMIWLRSVERAGENAYPQRTDTAAVRVDNDQIVAGTRCVAAEHALDARGDAAPEEGPDLPLEEAEDRVVKI